jgi:hypothetical protein
MTTSLDFSAHLLRFAVENFAFNFSWGRGMKESRRVEASAEVQNEIQNLSTIFRFLGSIKRDTNNDVSDY